MLFVSCTFQNVSNARNTHFNRNILTVSAFADTKRNALWTLSDKKQYCGQMKHLWQLQAENMRLHNGCTFVRRIANPPIRFSWHCYGKCTTLTTPHADCKSSRTQRIYSYPTHVKYFALKLRMNPTLTLPEYPWRERNILPVWKKNTFFSVKRNALADRTLRQPMQQNETYGKTKGHLLQAEIRSFSL